MCMQIQKKQEAYSCIDEDCEIVVKVAEVEKTVSE